MSESDQIYREVHAVIKRATKEYDELTVFQIVGALEAVKADVLDFLKDNNSEDPNPHE
jgi:hypothetical protein